MALPLLHTMSRNISAAAIAAGKYSNSNLRIHVRFASVNSNLQNEHKKSFIVFGQPSRVIYDCGIALRFQGVGGNMNPYQNWTTEIAL